MVIAAKAAAPAPATSPAAPKTRGRATAAAHAPAQPTTTASPAPSAAGVAFVSLSPDSFGVGGLIDDIDVEITDALAVMWDYNGQAPLGPALAVEYTDVNGGQHIQYYSCGKAEDWLAHESGEGFVPVSGKTGFNNTANIAMLFDSLVKASFPKEHLTGNVKVIIGTKGHVLQEVKERKGLIRTGKNADRPNSVLLFTKITELPEGVRGAGAAAVRTATAPATAGVRTNGAAATGNAAAAATGVTGGGDLDSEIQGYLMEALVETPVIEKKDIVKIVFKHASTATADRPAKTAAERNKMVIRAGQQDFLNSLAAVGISYTGTEISLAQ